MRVHLITCEETIKGKKVILVSHGVDENLKNVILPCEPLHTFGAKRDAQGLYVEMEDKDGI